MFGGRINSDSSTSYTRAAPVKRFTSCRKKIPSMGSNVGIGTYYAAWTWITGFERHFLARERQGGMTISEPH